LAEPRLAEPKLAEPKMAEPRLAEPKLAEHEPAMQPPDERELAEQVLPKPRPSESKPAQSDPGPVAEAEPAAKPLWPWAAAAAAVLAVVGGLYMAGTFGSRPAAPPPEAAAASVRPTPVSAEGPEQTQAAPSPAAVAVRLHAAENCWIMVSVGARQSFVGVLDAGQSKTFEATEPIRIRTGNAGGLSIEWNGKPVGSLGPHGQIRIIEFSPKEFKYLPLTPAKPAAATTGS
jgi:cytoskeleton protein RodZ